MSLPPPSQDNSPRRWSARSAVLALLVSVEWLVAFAATGASVYLHIQNMLWAGALWRDEAHTTTAALRPTLSDVWSGLATDNFPLFSTLMVRGWGWSEWGQSDQGLRALGAVVGVAILLAFWWIGWRVHRSPPTLALALWAFNPIAIRFSDSVRPYGVGMLMELLAIYAMGRLALTPGWRTFLTAAIACTLSVQCLYPNALFVLVSGLAGCAIALKLGEPRRLLHVLGAGAIAAASLVPYVLSIAQARAWAPLMETRPDIVGLMRSVLGTLGGENRAVLVIVLLILLTAVVVAFIRQLIDKSRNALHARDWSLYALLTGLVGTCVSLALLNSMRLPPQLWHNLPILVALAFMVDAILGYVGWASALRAGVLVGVALLSWEPSLSKIDIRYTNMDQVAAYLEEAAAPEDLIVVQPWYYGVTFHRYYHGKAPWITAPETGNTGVHRYDLLKQAMATPHVLGPINQRMSETLAAGHRVWMVGRFQQLGPGTPYEPSPTAPLLETGWRTGPFHALWEREVAIWLANVAEQRELITLPASRPAWSHEKVELRRIEGLRTKSSDARRALPR